jgi:hypothetical protein
MIDNTLQKDQRRGYPTPPHASLLESTVHGFTAHFLFLVPGGNRQQAQARFPFSFFVWNFGHRDLEFFLHD